MNIRLQIIAISFATVLTIGCSKVVEGDLIIKNINIIDVQSGEIGVSKDVSIKSNRIISIQKHQSDNQYLSHNVIDGSNQYLIPGLWDMHTHTWWGYKDFFPLLIANGITGIRDMFGDMKTIKQIRNEIKDNIVIGPEIISAGPIVDAKPAVWPGSDEAQTPEEGRKIVRNQKSDGVDFIKVYHLLKKEVYLAIADECNKQKIPFNGHIPRSVTLEEAVEAGHQSIEHFLGILEYCSSKKDYYHAVQNGEIEDTTLVGPGKSRNRLEFLVKSFDEKEVDKLIDLLSKNKTWVCPTSTVNRTFAYINEPEFRNDERIYYLPDYAITDWNPSENTYFAKLTDKDYQTERKWYKLNLSIMKRMLDGGCKFLAGTDYPNPYCYPGFSLHDELEIFVNMAGFTPLEALQTATINPAIFLERTNDFGTVETGKIANLVLLTENPLDKISNTRNIASVFVNGKYFDGDSLKANLEKIATKNKLPKIRNKLFPIVLEKGVDAAITTYYRLKKDQADNYNFDKDQLNSLGYQLLEMSHIKEAIKIFLVNTEQFPEYDNGFDSLGDAYLANNDTTNAIIAYEKAISLGFETSKSKLEELTKE